MTGIGRLWFPLPHFVDGWNQLQRHSPLHRLPGYEASQPVPWGEGDGEPMIGRRWAIVGTATVLAGCLWFFLSSPPRGAPRIPDGTSLASLETSLELDPDQPLSAAHTDVAVMILCTLRRDRLQAYDSPRPTSPFLLRLARQGVLFEHTIVQAPWTRPSVGSLITGIWPSVLQLQDPEPKSDSDRALADPFTTLAERMRAAGYTTIGVSGNPNVSSVFGFDQGFDVHHEPESFIREATDPPVPGEELAQTLLDELDKAGQGRVYLQALFVDTHYPRSPSEAALQVMRADLTPLPKYNHKMLNTYDAALRTLDGTLARLFIQLRKRRPNLLFVVIGDHGEGLRYPHHHGSAHGNYLYTSATDVPFIVFHPSLTTPGRRIQGLATGLDLVPTVLDLLGLPPADDADGISQRPAIMGQQDSSPHDWAFTATRFRQSYRTAVFSTEDGYHLILNHQPLPRDQRGPEELYRHDDALEEVDLAGARPQIVSRLSKRLLAWEEEMDLRASSVGAPLEVHVPDATRRMLQVLGYVD